jgi:hypothetical protein
MSLKSKGDIEKLFEENERSRILCRNPKTGNKIFHQTQRSSHPEGRAMSIDLMVLHKNESFSPSLPSAINRNK